MPAETGADAAEILREITRIAYLITRARRHDLVRTTTSASDEREFRPDIPDRRGQVADGPVRLRVTPGRTGRGAAGIGALRAVKGSPCRTAGLGAAAEPGPRLGRGRPARPRP